MKLLVALALYASPLVFGARFGARQADTCNQNNCFRAVWGSNPDLGVPPSAFKACGSHLTTTKIIYPM